MNLRFSDQPPCHDPDSIFLGGPTPRQSGVPSWRPAAIDLLQRLNYSGTVLIPERTDWSARFEYTDQIEWESIGLKSCERIAFWIPRDLDTLPGFTTNVEFGFWLATDPGKVRYGRPPASPKNRYLDHLYRTVTDREPFKTLEALLRDVVSSLKAN